MAMNTGQDITPDWPAPRQVRALVTTRQGGVSAAPYDSFNVATHVGDDPGHVARNRMQLQQQLGTTHDPQWLQQVHGTSVVQARCDDSAPQADACYTLVPGLPCAVLTADCLPVLFCTTSGDRVAAAHAGWRGLAAGILEQTLQALAVPTEQVLVWLGPAIGRRHFEVGEEVREAFLACDPACASAFVANPERAGRWFADLYRLARLRLHRFGVQAVYGGGLCTYADPARFYSYRRDSVTGRMASLIWLQPE